MAARVINQNLTHQLRGDGEKVRAVLPRDIPTINQPQVGFVNQRRGLQEMIGIELSQALSGEPVKLRVN
jgi:hypothetical protein